MGSVPARCPLPAARSSGAVSDEGLRPASRPDQGHAAGRRATGRARGRHRGDSSSLTRSPLSSPVTPWYDAFMDHIPDGASVPRCIRPTAHRRLGLRDWTSALPPLRGRRRRPERRLSPSTTLTLLARANAVRPVESQPGRSSEAAKDGARASGAFGRFALEKTDCIILCMPWVGLI